LLRRAMTGAAVPAPGEDGAELSSSSSSVYSVSSKSCTHLEAHASGSGSDVPHFPGAMVAVKCGEIICSGELLESAVCRRAEFYSRGGW
jgi:hypothetical protein